MKSVKLVTAAIVTEGDRILIARRAETEKYGGYWEFPGGKLEPGETEFQCIERELFEELGVRAIARSRMCEVDHPIENGILRLIAIQASLESREFQLTAHSETAWVAFTDLESYDLLPADISLIAKLRNPSDANSVASRPDDQ